MAGAARQWSIRSKSVGLAVLYIVALGAVYGGFTYSLVRSETRRAQDRLRQTAGLTAIEVDAYISSGRQRLATVSRLPGLTYGLRSMADAPNNARIPPWTSLHYLFFKSEVFTGGVFLLDQTGKVLWAEPPGQPWVGKRLLDESTFRALLESDSGTVSRGLAADALSEHPHVIIAYPVRNPDGGVDGVLGGVVDLTAPEVTKVVGAMSTEGDRHIEVVDQEGRVIISNDRGRLLQKAADANASSADLIRATAALTNAPFNVVAVQSRGVALADVRQFQRVLLIAGLGLLLIAVASGAAILNGFTRDITKLTQAAETMARGDLSQAVYIGKRQDEIGTLSRTLEQMRVELEHSRAALQRRIDEREELIRLKEAFLANISHELRTPLNAIIGYTDMLTDTTLDAQGRELAHAVRSQSEHLHQMLADLLTLSGLNVGKLAIEISPVHVPTLMNRLKPAAERLMHNKQLALKWDCPSSLPTVDTDPLRLEQIVTNLITNAFKFTNHGHVHVMVSADTQAMCFRVRDTGIGIPAAELPHIFDEFWQADGSRTSRYGGIGLGLALVKKLTGLLNGEVSVSSQAGGGSTFEVRLPLHQTQ